MKTRSRISRRDFVTSTCQAGLATLLPLPRWAFGYGQVSNLGTSTNQFDLTIGETPVSFADQRAIATGINGTVPGPLIRMREGENVTLNVTNFLESDSSIHWHGFILPSNMDGVPGLSFPGIRPGSTYRYAFDLVQNGTYWYHSHSGFQEQTGVYGPIIVDPAGHDPIEYDKEYVVMLSDWTFENPNRLFAKLKKQDDYYNRQRRTLADLIRDARDNGSKETFADRRMWGNMRMAASDIADVTGATYTYLLNGHDPESNWTGLFEPGEKVRLRIINGSAMTFFNFRIPGLAMSVVQTDGQNIEPIDVDEIQIGVAETYDVVVQPEAHQAFTIFAESMDRSGYARGTLSPEPGLSAPVPALRKRPLLAMADMGMDHSSMAGDEVDHSAMGHSTMGHSAMGHSSTAEDDRPESRPTTHDHKIGPGVANVVENPTDRLSEPGIGLNNVSHRVLTYADLKSLDANADQRDPARTIELHLTGNMERYMWSFDGEKYAEVKGPIEFHYGERLRLVLVNDTMMSHPIHLHGMFVELDNGNGGHNPRKHTVVVKPAERLAVNLTADAPGRWAFHCHMLYHMRGGMMREIAVRRDDELVS